MNKKIIINSIIACVLGIALFYGGFLYGKSSTIQVDQRGQGFGSGSVGAMRTSRSGSNSGGMGMGGFISGEVISKDDQGVTVKLRDGGSKIVFISPSTKIVKDTVSSLNDVVVGSQVSINGSSDTNGSITAQSVQIRSFSPTSTKM